MKILALAALMVLLASAAARASTPTAYRVRVNWICRSYVAAGTKLEARLKAGDGGALREVLRLDLEQDRRIEAVPVPAPLQAQMEPILDRLRAIDTHLRGARTRPAELLAVDRLARPLGTQLGAAGLADCGA